MILSENRAPSRVEAYIRHAVSCSPFLARLCSKDPSLLNDLLSNLHIIYKTEDLKSWFLTQKYFDEITLKQQLRRLRQHVLARIITRDINGLAELNEVMLTTSALAEVAINEAIAFHMAALVAIYGQPKSKAGDPQRLIVVGMGKLGGYELNVSSDIDLIFAYEQEGETDGPQVISNQDFFTRLSKKLIATIDDVTEDGFVFRVDMRLRPFGGEGVLVSCLDALEDYYQNYGREWERYAWIKGRVVAGPADAITRVLKPFVFRKYLDYNAYASMRDLKVQIQRDVAQRGLEDNIKLGRGGIREVEFIAQVFQLIRGGQEAELQIKPTLQVLQLLAQKRVLSQEALQQLSDGYIYLRNLEHRLMYIDDQQTQDIPRSEASKQYLLNMLNIGSWEDFLQQLNHHRAHIQAHFDATFSDAKQDKYALELSLWQGVVTPEQACQALQTLGYQTYEQSHQRLQMMRNSTRYQQLPEQSKQRLDKLMPIVISQAATMEDADTALLRTIHLLEHICRRASYLALLAEFPESLHLVIKLCAASPWLAQYLSAHPVLLDELLNTDYLYAAPDFARMKNDLSLKMQQLQGDTEMQMDAMRHFKHAAVLRFAAQDVAGALPLEVLSDYLSDLAQVILQVSLETIWQSLKFKHQATPQFAVIGYGKLGGKELGYLSDLDIIFLYDDAHPDAADIYARFAQRINNWFNSITNAGLLYETDMQLRPDGNSGLLVSSVAAFEQYQLTKAWVWEHQAITRARYIAGDAAIGNQFECIRQQVLLQKREPLALKQEVLGMREKMRATLTEKLGIFDIKHSLGGIIDVEFIVQYWVLAYAQTYPELTENCGNIALLKRMASLNILNQALADAVADAYRQYRALIHKTKLQEQTAKVSTEAVANSRQAVIQLWQIVFLNP